MKIKHNLFGIWFLLFGACICLVSSLSFANQQHIVKQSTDNQAWFAQNLHHKQDVQLRVDLFLSTTCPHCLAADQFFHKLETKKTWLLVHRYYVNKDKIALDRLNDLVQSQQIKINPFAVPAIFFCNARWLGFDDAQSAGAEIVKGLNYCHKQISRTGKLTPMTVNAIRKNGVSEWYESNITKNQSLQVLIPALAVLDALMPCSLFGFVVMFSFLFVIPKGNLRVVFSGLFLFCVGMIHYLQQVHTALFYEIIRDVNGAMIVSGLLLLGLLLSSYRKKHANLQLNCTLKGIALGCVAVLTVAGVYSYNQECVPNYALVFQQHLATQSLPLQQQFLYILLYQIIYLLILAFLLFIALAGSARIKYQQVLQKIVCLVLLFSAVFLIIYPVLLE